MKIFGLLLSVCLLSQMNRQTGVRPACTIVFDSLTQTNVYTSPEIEPQNEGGLAALMRAFQKIHLDSAMPTDLTFRIAFIVDEKGRIRGGRIVHNHSGTIGKQMLQVVRSLKWTPGKCDGQNVSVLVERPLILDLRGE